MAVASLILGIVALVFCWTGWFGIVSGALSLVFGILHLIKMKKADIPTGKGLSIAGIITGGIGLILAVIILIIAISAANTIIKSFGESDLFNTSSSSDLKSSYSVGEKASINGFELTVTGVSDYNSTSEYSQPEAGNKFIKVDISAVNNGTDDEYVSTYGFDCYADNTSVSSAYIYGVDSLAGANLSTGKNTSGSLYYEVPENAKSITLEYDYNIYRDQKIIFKLK